MPGRQLALEQRRHRRLRLAGAETGRRAAVDLGRRKAVVMHHLIRTVGSLHRDQRPERHHLAAGTARLQRDESVPAAAETADSACTFTW